MKAMTIAVGLLCAVPLGGLVGLTGAHGAVNGAVAGESTPVAASRPVDPEVARRPKVKEAFKPTEQQVAEAEAFIEQHSPNRFKAYKKTKETGVGTHQNLKRWIAKNHLELKAVESVDPELYAMKLDEMKIQDEIFGVVGTSHEKGDKLREQLRPMIKQLEAKRKEQALHRIERMKAALVAEQKQLDDMNEGSEGWIDRRLAEEMSRGGRLIPPAAGRRDVNGPTTAEN